jgi:hypothetical protein
MINARRFGFSDFGLLSDFGLRGSRLQKLSLRKDMLLARFLAVENNSRLR